MILETNNLSIGHKTKLGYSVVTENINISIDKGKLVALIGSNGIGKSTLINSIMRFSPVIKGEINIDNNKISELSNKDLSRLTSYVSSRLPNQNKLKIKDLIALGRAPHTNWIGQLKKNDYNIINDAINLLKLNHLKNKFIDQLSDGEMQKVLIARAIAQDTKLIIMDEPTSHLDLPSKYNIIASLKMLTTSKSKTILFSTHDLNIAFNYSDIILFMFKNKLIQTTPNELIKSDLLKNFFNKSDLSNLEKEEIINSIRIK